MNKRVFLMALLVHVGCSGELTAADCAPYLNRDQCEQKGCVSAAADRTLIFDGQCVGFDRKPVCLAASDSANNANIEVCRDLPEGAEYVELGSAYRHVDGWKFNCGFSRATCGVTAQDCETLTDRAACEAHYCYWAEPVRVGVLNDGLCTGWEPVTTQRCLTPSPWTTYVQGINLFDFDTRETVFSVETDEGRRIYSFQISNQAEFISGPRESRIEWRRCLSYSYDPSCGCPVP